ncbi:hypothetical protein LRP_1502 [Ligilactobacillus ruminis]|uniref:hypothetical protein n=1 Tax=Ligilactobacillus ruminis TaxID=1623 RepID=UPI00062CC389|nr:hypothetical protein [Ligilactobacillus ruminis]KLA43322.1 hypothetical protein LRP_1502 [Ligilactobacillus ruminis]
MSNNRIEKADRILKELLENGYFGAESQRMESIRKNGDIPELIYQSALSIVNEDYGNNKLIYNISNQLCLIYEKAIYIDSQKLKDILVSFMLGTKDNPNLENLSSYKNYMAEMIRIKKELIDLKNKENISYEDKLYLGNDFAAHYSSAVEFISKIATILLQLDYLISNKDVEMGDIVKKPTATKLNKLRQSKKCDWTVIVDSVDTHIRNAESHLNYSYDPDTKCFEGKYFNSKKRRYDDIVIPAEKFIGKIIKDVEAVILGFFLSIYVLYLTNVDRHKAERIAELMEI